jgi:hypothetical protein
MDLSAPDQILKFLAVVGERLQSPAEIYIYGGGALLLIGARRNTVDVDFALRAVSAEHCRSVIRAVAAELRIDAEENVPDGFMPLPTGADQRHRWIGQYGLLAAYILDPYSMAVMKLDRAFPTDIEDVVFLLRNGHVSLQQLEECVADVARRYDEPLKLQRHLAELKRGLA